MWCMAIICEGGYVASSNLLMTIQFTYQSLVVAVATRRTRLADHSAQHYRLWISVALVQCPRFWPPPRMRICVASVAFAGQGT